MKISKRDFLKISGLAALGTGVGLKSVVKAIETVNNPVITPNQGVSAANRWGMVIDTKKCTSRDGCRDCVNACHNAHNVPQINDPNHEVKWIWTEPYKNTFPTAEQKYFDEDIESRPFLVFCNHCDNPPCVRVCPTKATWRRADGVVMMDWHRCIGCRFCVAACPYGSRSFNWIEPRPYIAKQNPEFPTRTRGVVEKCNFCEERLAKGQLPACVEACKEGAMYFGNLLDPATEARRLLRERFSIRRQPELGTNPQIYYLV